MSSEETQIPVPDDSSGLCPEEAKVDERLEVVKFLDTFKPTDLEKVFRVKLTSGTCKV